MPVSLLLRRTLRMLSPFTNLGSRQFPLSRIRGASFKERFYQTYEVFRGHYDYENESWPHFGVAHHGLVVPTALYAAIGLLDFILVFVDIIPYAGPVLNQVLGILLGVPFVLAFRLLDFAVVVPVAFIMTALSTPFIALAHLLSPAKPDVAALTLALAGENTEGAAKLNPSTYRVTNSAMSQHGNDGNDFSLTLNTDDHQHKSSAVTLRIKTDAQREALRELTRFNLYGAASFFDYLPHYSGDKDQILDQLYPDTRLAHPVN